jgi:hypothetical protein
MQEVRLKGKVYLRLRRLGAHGFFHPATH